MGISVIIPTYNSRDHIASTIAAVLNLSGEHRPDEIVVVDDCSTDETVAVLRNIAATTRDARILVVCLRRNMGQATATAVGLAAGAGDVLVTMDDDLQHDPAEIGVLVDALGSGELDFVVGRFQSTDPSALRRMASRIVHAVARRMYRTPRDFSFSSFCAVRGEFVKAAELMQRQAIELGWTFSLSSRYQNVDVSHSASIRGRSTYSLRRLLRAARPFFVATLHWLMRPLAGVALGTVAVAVALSAYYAFVYFTLDQSIPGFATLAILGLMNIALVSFVLSLSISLYRRVSQIGNEAVGRYVVGLSADATRNP